MMMKMRGCKCTQGGGGGISRREGERKGYQGVRFMYTYEDNIMNATKLFKREGKGKREWEYNGGVNLSKVHCTYVWHYHMKLPRIINALIQK
jgi:hypothetical protein